MRYEQPLSPNVINNPVIASTSGRGNLIKSTSNDPEPMRLLRRFAPHNDKSKKCAFTLAEVMIAIGIVGVVAAITIPSYRYHILFVTTLTIELFAWVICNNILSLCFNFLFHRFRFWNAVFIIGHF